MNKETIITQMYLDKDISQAIGKMQPVELQDDLRQEIFLVLCEMDNDRLLGMWNSGYLKYFVVRTMLNMAKSDRSTFFNQFRRSFAEYCDNYEKADEGAEIHEEMDSKLKQSMGELHWYEKNVFELYAENGRNILKLSRDTKIPYRSLFKTVTKVKKKLSKAVRKEDNQQKKLIGNYIHAGLDVVIDINKETDMDTLIDIIDEVNAFIREKVEGRSKDDVCIKQIGGLKIKQVI
jgi:DNA-directed RNA polymerase specialized sigma24 family protein